MQGEAETILVIDDEEGVRQVFATYLESVGHQVLTAENGRIGLDLIQERNPALVLSDLRMPAMDGLAVLKVVTEKFEQIPVILVSGVGELGDTIQALKLGAWDYVTKPTRMPVLKHAVDRALERVRLLRENREYQSRLEATNRQLRESLATLQQDEEAGRQIQFQLLPEDGLCYGPCRFNRTLLPSSSLSGDFVDYFRIDDRHLGFYLADVSGHGVSSALITVILKSSMTHHLEDYWQQKSRMILDPVALLDDFNDTLLKQKLEKYLTIFYAILDLENNLLRFANGGQFPFPILFDGAKATYIGNRSLPVGLFDQATYQMEEQVLSEQFLIVLCSDGIFEVLPQFNVAEKEAQVLSMVNSVDITTQQFIAKLGIEEETVLSDDVTVLFIKR